MAYEDSLRSVTLNADSTLAVYTGVPGLPGSADPNGGKQYNFVKVTGARQCGLATAAANEIPVGVLQNKPQYTGQAATVGLRGISKVEAGGNVSAGNAIKIKATGQGVAATLPADVALVVGIALSSAADGQIFTCLLQLGN